jgi:uncharacterized protein
MGYAENFEFSRRREEYAIPASTAETWIVTDGAVGMEAQGRAVAEAVGLPYALRGVRVGGPLALLPVPLQLAVPPKRLLGALRTDTPFQPPWPRLIISIGRRSVPVALAVKRASGGKSFALHIQNPKVPLKLFDLIAAPLHDGLKGDNVIETFGAVHSIDRQRLEQAVAAFAAELESLPRPRIAVMLGGKSNAFDFPPETATEFGRALARLARSTGGSLLVSPSRRTPDAAFAALASQIAEVPSMVWNGTGDNPYFAFLGSADAIIVTGDSVNMVTEAAGTGKPVLVQPLPGKSARLALFHQKMREAGITRPFKGEFESWSYTPVNDTEKVASIIRAALKL